MISCENPCVVAVSYDGGATYIRLTATAAENGYRFTAENMTADTVIAVILSGDADGDGQLTAADAAAAADAYTGQTTLGALEQLAADVNQNGKVTNADVTKLRAVLAGKTTLSW